MKGSLLLFLIWGCIRFLLLTRFLVVDTRSVETTIVRGPNMQICHSLRFKGQLTANGSLFSEYRLNASANTLKQIQGALNASLCLFSPGKLSKMQLRESSAINASILIMWRDTSHVCTLSKVIKAEAILFRGLIIRILRLRWKANRMEKFKNLLVKSGPGNLDRQDERNLK